MTFKDKQVEQEFEYAPYFLKIMAHEFDSVSNAECGIDPIMTRVLEKVEGSSGVHEDYRGIDFRDEHAGKRFYTDEQVKKLCDYMNAVFERNDGKLTMIHHEFCGGPLHFHIQLSIFTKVYMPKKPKEEMI